MTRREFLRKFPQICAQAVLPKPVHNPWNDIRTETVVENNQLVHRIYIDDRLEFIVDEEDLVGNPTFKIFVMEAQKRVLKYI
jgi:hypothetical protein